MIIRPNYLRMVMASAAVATAVALAGCKTEGNFAAYSGKATAPIPPKLLVDIANKNMDVGSPILVRVFKTESELEVWKADRNGQFALLKTYPICKWSGDLGPKVKEGDRQAPEGFYEITPGQMNPNSQFHLAFNLGYPNAYDRAHDRTGAHLMVHGDCSSRGCYAMSDEQISEIFALGRESFFAGQKSFQVQAYPFRMTPANMAKHRNNPNIPFWRMLKQGNDHFEVTRTEPRVDVCEKRYVFNAAAPGSASSAMSFSPKGRCPVYEIPQEIAGAVLDKQRRDDSQFAQLAARGAPVAPISSGRDGGMHPTFVAKLQPREVIDERGNAKLIVDRNNPGMIAYSAAQTDSLDNTTSSVAAAPVQVANVPIPRNAPQSKVGARPTEQSFAEKLGSLFRIGSTKPETAPQTRVASAEPMELPKAAPKSEGVKAKVSRMIGLRGSNDNQQSEAPARSVTGSATTPEKIKTAAATETSAPQTRDGLLNGAQPIPQSSNFDSRWTAFR